jgi:hypothetical protein
VTDEERSEPRLHGPDDDCPACYECPGCGGGGGATPVNWRLDRTTYPGAVMLICTDCDGTGFTCPNLVVPR